ncbi:hypothetical protein PBI_LAMBO_56 [Gordonia phage Lambo]|uniref:Uncharacterized protein n=1 Tax=Gordonia phage Lambo TaxID=2599845 RepID=A0A5J6TRV7_9CAUD|nr:hypothetical protein HWC70_gp56 [Gordonia phage Lambo]QFG13565.1 hypothetical protein PBI_LAMBO_56 [Gordonia phage Lambo]
MSGMDKAQAFAAEAQANGWTTKIETKNGDETHVEAERKGERITIWWRGNSLIETPFHHFMGQVKSLHNKATATRQLSMKPNPKGFRGPKMGARFVDLKLTEEGGLPEEVDLESIRYPLPFDPKESTDGEILKEIRGSTIIFVNRISGKGESVHVARSLNMKPDNFYLEESTEGKLYVTFLSATGFRSVYIDSILRIM